MTYTILGNNGQTVAQLVQANPADVHAVNGDAPLVGLQDAKEGQCER